MVLSPFFLHPFAMGAPTSSSLHVQCKQQCFWLLALPVHTSYVIQNTPQHIFNPISSAGTSSMTHWWPSVSPRKICQRASIFRLQIPFASRHSKATRLALKMACEPVCMMQLLRSEILLRFLQSNGGAEMHCYDSSFAEWPWCCILHHVCHVLIRLHHDHGTQTWYRRHVAKPVTTIRQKSYLFFCLRQW